MIEIGLASLLSSTPSITALVNTNIFPVTFPEGFTAFPAITYKVIASMRQYNLSGYAGYTESRLQYDIWGKSYLSIRTIKSVMIAALDNYKGTLSDGSVIMGSRVLSIADFFEHDALSYRTMIEFYFDHA